MSEYLQLLVTVMMYMNGLYVQPTQPTYANSTELRRQVLEFAKEIAPYYAEIGAADLPPRTDNFSFAIYPVSAVGATESYNRICTSHYTLSVTWLYSANVFYGTDDWRAVVAHELAHVLQGFGCRSGNAAESSADLIGYGALAAAGEDAALVAGLRREFILAALTQGITEGVPRAEILDPLGLPAREYDYYRYYPYSDLRSRGAIYWLPLTKTLLADDDGKFSVVAPNFAIDARELYEFMQTAKEHK